MVRLGHQSGVESHFGICQMGQDGLHRVADILSPVTEYTHHTIGRPRLHTLFPGKNVRRPVGLDLARDLAWLFVQIAHFRVLIPIDSAAAAVGKTQQLTKFKIAYPLGVVVLNILSIDFASSRRRDHFPFHCAVIDRVSGKIDQVVGYVEKGENVDMIIISIVMHLVCPTNQAPRKPGSKQRATAREGFFCPHTQTKGNIFVDINIYLNDNRQVCCHIF